MSDEPDLPRFGLLGILTAFIAALLWAAVLLFTTGSMVSPPMTATILGGITVALYLLLHDQRDAWPRSALIAGIIAILSLLSAWVWVNSP